MRPVTISGKIKKSLILEKLRSGDQRKKKIILRVIVGYG